MTDMYSIRMLLLQMECGVIRYDRSLREYLITTLGFLGARSRAAERGRRRRIWQLGLGMVPVLAWLIVHEINAGLWDVSALWPPALAAAGWLVTRPPSRERQCLRHFECALQRSVGQVSSLFVHQWQSQVPPSSLRQYSEALEWDLEWRLKRWESRIVMAMLAGLLLCLCLVGKNLGSMYCCFSGDLG